MAELYYLNNKHGQPIDFASTLTTLEQSEQFVFISFEAVDVLDFEANAAAPEMHDRMIVGVARKLGAPCITYDRQITGSGLVVTVGEDNRLNPSTTQAHL